MPITKKPLCVDLYAGLGGWAEGFLAEGYRVQGYDIEKHDYGTGTYPGELFIRDVRSLHGSQFADAAVIVASPPCNEYSYMAMPWSRAKQIARALRGKGEFPCGYTGSRTIEDLNALFDACFRIQREASEAAGRHIPMIVENVRGACPWVGRSAWNYGSFHLWGDVPALMPITFRGERKSSTGSWDPARTGAASGGSFQSASVAATSGLKLPGNSSNDRWSERPIQRLKDFIPVEHHGPFAKEDGVKVGNTSGIGSNFSWNLNEEFQALRRDGVKVGMASEREGVKVSVYSDPRRNGGKGSHLKSARENLERLRDAGTKQEGSGPIWFDTGIAAMSSKGHKRKAASAEIAKIPLPLALHIARMFLRS